jgi:hypothetical protein
MIVEYLSIMCFTLKVDWKYPYIFLCKTFNGTEISSKLVRTYTKK